MGTIMFNKAIKTGLCAAVALAVSGEVLAQQWDVSLWGKQRAFTEHVEKLAQLVSAKTNGEFTLNISYGGLSKNKENLDGISIGAFQMAQFCAGYHRDKNPSITVLELPFLGVSSLEQERSISQALYQHPAVVKDLARWNATLLMPSPLPQYNIVGVGDAPQTLSDYEGLSVRATGGIGKAMSAVGAVPTSMSASEVRQALDSGVVKAVAFAPHAHMSFGTVEAGEWWTTNLNPGTVNCPVVVNTEALADLSDAHRNALLGSVDESLDHYIATYNGKTMDAWGPTLEAKGIQSISYTNAELAAFRAKVAGPAAASWIEDNAAKGLPAQELYDLVTGLIAQ
jgi:TRAP-type C4-dicarboxylate transport system substrate-binding protein|tara:strand:+ start:1457 stop:2476 length:1020 start_codon:yes stop_codon:yes gene_type:complete